MTFALRACGQVGRECQIHSTSGGVSSASICQTAREANAPPPGDLRRPGRRLFFPSPRHEGRRSAERRTWSFSQALSLPGERAPLGAPPRPRHGRTHDRRRAALSPERRPALSRGEPSAVSQLLAGGRSTPGRSPGAARGRACEARLRAPHRPKTGNCPVPATGSGTASSGAGPGPLRRHDAS